MPEAEPASPSPDFVVQGLRDAAAARFEAYHSQLEQLERTFIRERKQADHQSTRTVSRFSDAILALSTELSQLTKRSEVLSQKVKRLRDGLDDATSSALGQAFDPVRANFQELESEQTRASSDIAELFGVFTQRTKKIGDSVDALGSVPAELAEFSNAIEQLRDTAQKNSSDLAATHEDFFTQMKEQQALFLQQIDGRVRDITTKLDGFRAKAQTAAGASQDLLADLEASQFEFRTLHSQAISRVQLQFTGQMVAIKRRFAQLTELRYSQILEIREQIVEANNVLRLKRQAMLQKGIAERAVAERRASRIGDEIRTLGQQCDAMEALLATEVSAPAKRIPPAGVRVFYNVGADGFVRLIFIDRFGVIGP
jgi:uncharacterized protein YoxC